MSVARGEGCDGRGSCNDEMKCISPAWNRRNTPLMTVSFLQGKTARRQKKKKCCTSQRLRIGYNDHCWLSRQGIRFCLVGGQRLSTALVAWQRNVRVMHSGTLTVCPGACLEERMSRLKLESLSENSLLDERLPGSGP